MRCWGFRECTACRKHGLVYEMPGLVNEWWCASCSCLAMRQEHAAIMNRAKARRGK
jgi:hypothetical protein